MRVVLPQPVGPTMAMRWPGLTSRFKLLDEGTVRQVAEGDILQLPHGRPAASAAASSAVGRLWSSASSSSKHAGRAGQGVLQLGDDAGDLVEGLGVLVGVAEKDAQLADGDAARRRRRAHPPAPTPA